MRFLMVISRVPPFSCMAKAALVARFMSICCISTGDETTVSKDAFLWNRISTVLGMEALRKWTVSPR